MAEQFHEHSEITKITSICIQEDDTKIDYTNNDTSQFNYDHIDLPYFRRIAKLSPVSATIQVELTFFSQFAICLVADPSDMLARDSNNNSGNHCIMGSVRSRSVIS